MTQLTSKSIRRALLCIFLPSVLFCQVISWQESQGLSGTEILAISRSSLGYMFVGTQSGIYRSTDDGRTWHLTQGKVDIRSFAISPTHNVFAGWYENGVLKSTNSGRTWQACGLTGIQIFSMAASKQGILFAGGYGTGMYRSIDNGASWQSVNSGLTNGMIMAIAVDSLDRVFAGTYGGGIFRSSDLGLTWIQMNNGLLNRHIMSISVVRSSELFVGTHYTDQNHGLYLSTDGGSSWERTPFLIPSVRAIVSNSAGHYFLIGPGDGVRRSTDDRISWDYENSGLSSNTVNSILFSPTEAIVVGTSSGVFRTTRSTVTNTSTPSNATLLTPVNKSTGVSTNPVLVWGTAGLATAYGLQVATDPAFSQLFLNQLGISTTSFPISNLLNNTTYYWRLSSYNASDSSAISDPWSFLTRNLLGDVTGNGSITAMDASFVLQHAANLAVLEGNALQASDVSGNGSVTAYDAGLILQFMAGIIFSFPGQ